MSEKRKNIRLSEENVNFRMMNLIRKVHGMIDDPDIEKHRHSQNQVGALLCHFMPEYTQPAAIVTTRALLQGVEFQKIGSIGTSGGHDSGNGDGDIVDDPTA